MSMGCCNGYHEFNLDYFLNKFKTLQKNMAEVDDYIKNLDVTAEINAKLEEMQANGEILSPYGLIGKKIAWFGDSLIWGDSGDSGHTAVENNIPKLFDIYAGTSHVSYARKSAMMCSYLGGTNNLQNQISGANLDDCDIAVIAFCTNDYTQGAPIGDFYETSWYTFCGALNNAIAQIKNMKNDIQVVVFGMFPSASFFGTTRNRWRCRISAYAYALQKVSEINRARFISVVDCAGVTKNNLSAISLDGTHFTQAGYEILAVSILNAWGGLNFEIAHNDNAFNGNSYPSIEQYGRYPVRYNGESNAYTSYVSGSVTPGEYIIEFDYETTYASVLDPENYYYGFHMKVGDNYFVSPIGLIENEGHIFCITSVDDTLNGLLSMRFGTNDENANCTNMIIKNLKIMPINGKWNFVPESEATRVENVNGSIMVSRFSNGNSRIKGNLSIADSFEAYATIASGVILQEYVSAPMYYFPVMQISDGKAKLLRGQVNSAGQLSVNAALQSGDKLTFTI